MSVEQCSSPPGRVSLYYEAFSGSCCSIAQKGWSSTACDDPIMDAIFKQNLRIVHMQTLLLSVHSVGRLSDDTKGSRSVRCHCAYKHCTAAVACSSTPGTASIGILSSKGLLPHRSLG